MTTPQTRPSGPAAPRPASAGPAPTTAAPASARERALAGVDALSTLLGRCNRADLDARVAAARRRLEQTTCTVLVVGEFKKGKSSLINALVNAPICPVDDDAATAKPIEVHYSATPEASVVLRAASPTERTEDMPPATRPLDFDDISAYAAEPTTAPDADQVAAIRLGLPRQLLATGLVLVDTPGVGGLASTHSAVTVSVLPSADAVLFVTDASQELTASELEFLRTAVAMCPTVTCILTKIDFYPAWRKIRDLDAEHLGRAGRRRRRSWRPPLPCGRPPSSATTGPSTTSPATATWSPSCATSSSAGSSGPRSPASTATCGRWPTTSSPSCGPSCRCSTTPRSPPGWSASSRRPRSRPSGCGARPPAGSRP